MNLSRLLLLGAAAVTLAGCGDDGPTTVNTAPQAYVRYLHASPDLGRVDVRFIDQVENLPTWFNVPFRSVTGYYQPVNAGTRHMRVFTTVPQPPNPGSELPARVVVDDPNVVLEPNTYYTIIQVGLDNGGAGDASLAVIRDELPAAPAGVSVRLLHAATGMANLDLYAFAGGTTGLGSPAGSASNVAFLGASSWLDVPARPADTTAAGYYRFAAAAAGGATSVAESTPRTTADISPRNAAGSAEVPSDATGSRPVDAVAGTQIAGSVLTAVVVPGAVVGSPAETASNTTPTILFLPDRNPARISP